MPKITIRQVTGAEVSALLAPLRAYAFDSTPPLPAVDTMVPYLSDATNVALFEDDVAVACAASSPMTQQVRGAILPCGGVWGVASHPAARRKGYVRQVMTELFALLRADGTP